MPMKRDKPEQIVVLLLQFEVEIANGKTAPRTCKEVEITVQIIGPISPERVPLRMPPSATFALLSSKWAKKNQNCDDVFSTLECQAKGAEKSQ